MNTLLRRFSALAALVALVSAPLAAEAQVAPEPPPGTLSEADHVRIARAVLDTKRSAEKWAAGAQVLDLVANGAIVASIAAIGATSPVGSLPGILCLAGSGVINVSALLTDLRAKSLAKRAELMERQFRDLAGADADRYFRAALFAPYVSGDGTNVARTGGTRPGAGSTPPSGSTASGAAGAGMPR